MADVDAKLMARAIEIAQGGDPSPNPHVGSVVADGETILAEGFHAAVGLEHAEIVALREAGESARGKTLYVTLEPCNHEGRTPPCVDAILAAGIGRVVVGCKDPNPGVEGGGIERLEAAGVEVVVGVLEDAATNWFGLQGFEYLDLARLWQVLLVVGLRLGCLNHAQLTHAAIRADGLRYAGWIGNQVDPAMPHSAENIAWLTAAIGEPFALVPWSASGRVPSSAQREAFATALRRLAQL